MITYKTKDGTQSGFLPGIGQIVDGKITVADDVLIENANLVKVEDQAQPQPQPAPVIPAAQPLPASPPPTNLVDQVNQINKEIN